MRRDELATLGIQLPVLPTIVLGALPGAPEWAARLERIGLDVVSSGAGTDTPATLAAAAASVPHRPLKAAGDAPGATIREAAAAGPDGYRLLTDEIVVAVDGTRAPPDLNDVAREVLEQVADDPSAWWVAARGLVGLRPADAEARLAVLVEGVRLVRLYLAKQQFG